MTFPKSQIAQQAKQLSNYVSLACKERFRGSYLGFFWAMFHPLVPLVVHNLVFSHLLSRNPWDYLYFVASGFFPWFFLSQTVLANNRSLLQHMAVLRSQPSAVPLLFSSDALTTLLPGLVWLPLLWMVHPSHPFAYLLAVLSLLVGTVAVSFLFSVIQIFFRDVRFLLPLVFQCGLFLTPLLYPRSSWPLAQWISHPAWINPLYLLVEPIQGLLTHQEPSGLAGSLLLSTSLGVASLWVWQTRRQEVLLHA